jgi:amino acid transporter
MTATQFVPERSRSDIGADYPEHWQYRLKKRLLGRPLVSEQLGQERLPKAVAFGVLAPDMISSSAYGTEQMLVIMTPLIGIGAFSLVIPVTLAIIAVLFFVLLSYLQVIGVYTKAGGSYVVARDNFGPRVAQIAAVSLLIDYIVTVAVQTSAGTAALASALPGLAPLTVHITVGVTLIMLYGNLRGIREAGRAFAFPTYFFVASLSMVVIIGIFKGITGQLHPQAIPSNHTLGYAFGQPGNNMLMGLSIFFLLKAFANGGASLTGLEAVSNGISSFRKPESRNGRITLAIMCCILAFLVLGTSLLAHWTHAVPYQAGIPTVVSQEVQLVLGTSGFANTLFLLVQLATVLILFTGGNTSFNGFPYLASFVANDSFLPRQLTKRGHRLTYSNGIMILAVVAIALIVAFQARVNALVGLYAIGVFTGFTMAGAGMVKHHLRERQTRWRLGVVVNGFSGALSLAVVVILMITKFTEGAWLILAVAPPMYFGLLRLHRQYVDEAEQLEVDAVASTQAKVLPRHVIVVLAGELDMATVRAIQYARTLRPDELRVVHFDRDTKITEELIAEWERLGFSRLPLEVVECRDRRIDRATLEYTAGVVVDGRTECTVLLPRRGFNSRLGRMLHDRTADFIAEALAAVPHVSATIVPFNLTWDKGKGRRVARRIAAKAKWKPDVISTDIDRALATRSGGAIAINQVEWRRRAKVAGRIRSMKVQPAKNSADLECVITDDTGNLLLVFMGRPKIPGIEPGARLVAEGMVGSWNRQLAILNPQYELVAKEPV